LKLKELHSNLTKVKLAQQTQSMNATLEDQKLVGGESTATLETVPVIGEEDEEMKARRKDLESEISSLRDQIAQKNQAINQTQQAIAYR
jgi:Tfp pilus assembly protein FimV